MTDHSAELNELATALTVDGRLAAAAERAREVGKLGGRRKKEESS
jgi:hypothetical protein